MIRSPMCKGSCFQFKLPMPVPFVPWDRKEACPCPPFRASWVPNEKGVSPSRILAPAHQEHRHRQYQRAALVKATRHSRVHGVYPDRVGVGSPWVHRTLEWHCRLKNTSFLLCCLCFPLFLLVSCNCFVLFLLQQIYISGL